MKTAHSEEGLVKTRIAIDQVRLSRLATQNSIERSRHSLAETRSILNALRNALLSPKGRIVTKPVTLSRSFSKSTGN